MGSTPTTLSATDGQPSSAKSLEQLSVGKTLEVLQGDENAVNTLLNLDDEHRQVLLPHLWKEYMQPVAIKEQYTAAERRTPLADGLIYFRDAYKDSVPNYTGLDLPASQ
jgi:hypothetical protein